jgi:hypothetical protein
MPIAGRPDWTYVDSKSMIAELLQRKEPTGYQPVDSGEPFSPHEVFPCLIDWRVYDATAEAIFSQVHEELVR